MAMQKTVTNQLLYWSKEWAVQKGKTKNTSVLREIINKWKHRI